MRDLRLPRQALVNVIVRGGEAIPPRGSTEIEGGDELHVLVRGEVREEVEKLMRRWREGPLDEPPRPRMRPSGAPQIFHVRPWLEEDGDAGRPGAIGGVEVAERLRTRRDSPGALDARRRALRRHRRLAGRVGPRRAVADWAARRVARHEGGGRGLVAGGRRGPERPLGGAGAGGEASAPAARLGAPGPRRPPRRSRVGLGRVRRPEDGRARDEQAAPAGDAVRRSRVDPAVDLDRARPPPRRSRSTLSGESAMKGWPPQPG